VLKEQEGARAKKEEEVDACSEGVSIRQHTSVYVSRRQQTSEEACSEGVKKREGVLKKQEEVQVKEEEEEEEACSKGVKKKEPRAQPQVHTLAYADVC
jgi:hypothetical protein